MSRSFLLRWTNSLSEQSAPFTRGRFPAAFKAGLSALVRALSKNPREAGAIQRAGAARPHLQPLQGGRTVLTQLTAVSRPNGAAVGTRPPKPASAQTSQTRRRQPRSIDPRPPPLDPPFSRAALYQIPEKMRLRHNSLFRYAWFVLWASLLARGSLAAKGSRPGWKIGWGLLCAPGGTDGMSQHRQGS